MGSLLIKVLQSKKIKKESIGTRLSLNFFTQKALCCWMMKVSIRPKYFTLLQIYLNKQVLFRCLTFKHNLQVKEAPFIKNGPILLPNMQILTQQV